MPLIEKRKVLAAKLQTAIGTPATLASGTDGIVNAYDVEIDPESSFNKRIAPGAFGRQPGNVGAYYGGVKFKVEAVGSGTSGTAPAWALVLLEACGMTQSAGLFSPSSAFNPAAACTIAGFEDGAKKFLTDAMGAWTFDGDDGKVGVFTFDFKGIWQPVVDASMFTPQFSTVMPPRFAGATITMGDFHPTLSKLQIKYGNQVQMRQDAGNANGTGYVSAVITDREVTGSMDPEQTLVATYDAFGAWLAGTSAELTVTIGSGGTGLSMVMPAVQYDRPKEGARNGVNITTLQFMAQQNGSTTDSEITIQF